ncbi:MAG: hypothetical protein FRX48_05935 [Lasallia pustulata]|uniref:Enoyl reductase (ER) domain-containing protein n=1 Tax=Lasallia pustulata TaxID=136370 RepID=A0A5M8PNG0_9LECA|nr:MAG: hypothetical protein FRX48_05935 [Lasallia pustulata]
MRLPSIPVSPYIPLENCPLTPTMVDWKVQVNGYIIKAYPNVLGSDIAGTVESVGEGVTHFKSGDKVTGFAAILSQNNPDHGAFQEYTTLKDNCAAKIPSSMSFEEGSILPMSVATAGVGIFIDLGVPRPPEKQKGGFLVWGGSSSVGSGAVQIAASLGFTVYAVASAHNHDYVKGLGATEVFDYNQSDITKDIISAAKAAGTEIKYVYDAISANGSSPQCAAVLEEFGGGKLVTTLPWAEDAKKPSNVTVQDTVAGRIAMDQQEFGRWLFNDWLEKALAEKTFVPSPAVQKVDGGLASVQKTLDLLAKGVSGKKLVIPL